MTLVYERPIDGPKTHAFVIGCGRFSHYPNDISRDATVAGARAIVAFLRDKADELVAPLSTIELLLSDPAVEQGSDRLDLPKSAFDPRDDDKVDPALLEHAAKAGSTWTKRCNPGDHLVFYMSSHGVVERDLTAIGLFEDFYSDEDKRFAQAINVTQLSRTVSTKGAAACWIFFDACQEIVTELLEQPDGSDALVLLTPSIRKLAQTPNVCMALAGSRFGGSAWAPKGSKPPFFTQVLLDAITRSAVALMPNLGWVVTGQRLLFDLGKVADASLEIASLETEALTPFNRESAFVKIAAPEVPVVVRTMVEAHLGKAQEMVAFDAMGNPVRFKPAGDVKWRFRVPADGARYKIKSKFEPDGPTYKDQEFDADPAAQIIWLTQ